MEKKVLSRNNWGKTFVDGTNKAKFNRKHAVYHDFTPTELETLLLHIPFSHTPPPQERVCMMGISVLTAEKDFSVAGARASGHVLGTGEARKMNQNKPLECKDGSCEHR